jgi:cell division protein FtsZ
MANGSKEEKKPDQGRISMFRKLAGSRGKAKEVRVAEPAGPAQSAKSVEAPAPAETSAPAAASELTAESHPPNPQPRLDGMDTVDRIPTFQGDEDLLEIPAFLRRQAN